MLFVIVPFKAIWLIHLFVLSILSVGRNLSPPCCFAIKPRARVSPVTEDAVKKCVICGGKLSRAADRTPYYTLQRLACDFYFKVLWEKKRKVTRWNMKFLLPSVVIFFVLCQVFGEESGPKEDLDYWTGSNQIQVRISSFAII